MPNAESTVERITEAVGERLRNELATGRTYGPDQDWDWHADADGKRCAYISVDATGVRQQGLGGHVAEGRMPYVGMVYNPVPELVEPPDRQPRRAAMQDRVVEDEDFAVGDEAWSKLATLPENIVDTRKVVIANHALARVRAWKESGTFIAPHVKFTPNQIVIESPQGIVVAPRGNGASFPARAMERMEDPI